MARKSRASRTTTARGAPRRSYIQSAEFKARIDALFERTMQAKATRPRGVDAFLQAPTARSRARILPAPRQTRLTRQRPQTRDALRADGTAKPVRRLQRNVPEALREAICADRKTRRQMVFATKKQGRAGGSRPKQRTIWSEVKC